MITQHLVDLLLSPITFSEVSPEKRFTGGKMPRSDKEAADSTLDASGLVVLFCARCFFSSAKVPAFMVTDTWMLILPLLSVEYDVSVGTSTRK